MVPWSHKSPSRQGNGRHSNICSQRSWNRAHVNLPLQEEPILAKYSPQECMFNYDAVVRSMEDALTSISEAKALIKEFVKDGFAQCCVSSYPDFSSHTDPTPKPSTSKSSHWK